LVDLINESVRTMAARWLAVYVPTMRSPRNVMIATQRVRDYLEPFLGNRRATSIRPDDLRRYRLWLEGRELAPRTVRHVLSDVRCLMRWGVDAEILQRSPFPARIMPRIAETFPDRLSDEDLVQVQAIPEPQAFIVRLAVATGLRWGELCRAHAEHVRDGVLEVGRTKSGRVRRVPLSPEMLGEIRRRVGPLVPYVEGSAGSFNKFVRRHSGLAGFHVHQLRHTFACKWIERGGSLPALQQVLGHASVTTTQLYAKLSDDAVRREAERVFNAQGALTPSPNGAEQSST
jgi:integrase